MRKVLKYIFAVAATVMAVACQKDEKIVLENYGSGTEIEFIASTNNVIITSDVVSFLGVQFAWDVPAPVLSQFGVANNVYTYKIEMSLVQDFSAKQEVTVSGNSHSFTRGALNSVMNRMAVVFNQPNDVFVRLAVYAGVNIAPVYSASKNLSVTPYEIDFSRMLVVDYNDNSNVLGTIYSPDVDGKYAGFVYMSAWKQGYFMASDGEMYGSAPVPDNPFTLKSRQSGEEVWNFWFPGKTGVYYVEVDLGALSWSATAVELGLVGDASGTFLYDTDEKASKAVFTTTTANSGIKISATGKRYDKDSATDDSKATDHSFWLASENSSVSGALTISETEPAISIIIATPDTYTLSVNLDDPTDYNYSVDAGGVLPPSYPDKLYMWTKDSYGAYHSELTSAQGNGIYNGTYTTSAGWENFLITDEPTWGQGTVYGCSDNSQALVAVPADEYAPENLWFLWFDGTVGTVSVEVNLNTNQWTQQ